MGMIMFTNNLRHIEREIMMGDTLSATRGPFFFFCMQFSQHWFFIEHLQETNSAAGRSGS